MDTLSAFAMGQANLGRPHKVFDWKKAAEIIRDEKPNRASAGLAGDWEYTGGDIYRDGKMSRTITRTYPPIGQRLKFALTVTIEIAL